MDKVIINSYEEFEKLVGQQIGVSGWKFPRSVSISLLMLHWIISGFMWMQNAPRWKVPIRVRLFTDI